MKWLKRIGIVIGGLIVTGIISSFVVTNVLNSRITVTYEHGNQEGHAQG